MAVIIQQVNSFIEQEGGFAYFLPGSWTNPAHVVNVYCIIKEPFPAQMGKVPILYMTQLDTFTVGGEATQYAHETKPIVWGSAAIQVLRNNGSNVFVVYRRRNGIPGRLNIRFRQINFSI